MKIETDRFHDDGRPVTRSVKLNGMDDTVRFNDDGIASVSPEVADVLIGEVDSIVASGGDETDDADSGVIQSYDRTTQ